MARKTRWARGYSGRVDAETARAECERIRERDGGITAPAVVDAARPEDAPLHPEFEWRDEVAAEAYREGQARRMVRALVTVDAPDDQERREYVLTVREPMEVPAYQPTVAVASDADLRRAAVRRLVRNLRGCVDGIADLAEQAGDEEWMSAVVGIRAQLGAFDDPA